MRSAEEAQWLIWSTEHMGWWKPGRMGYTCDWLLAGRYGEKEAREICDSANKYSDRVEERMIRVEDVMSGRFLDGYFI